MTRKDFELIAEIINGSKNYLTTEQVEDLADDFVLRLSLRNPRFNKEIFRKTCGVE